MYRWRSRAHPAAVRRELVAHGWALHLINGRRVVSAGALFDRCTEVLAFPSWFGRTFDGLAFCLGDLSWLSGRGHVVLWEAWGVLAGRDPWTWRQAYRVFGAAAAERVAGAPPLYLLLRGDGPTTDIPVL